MHAYALVYMVEWLGGGLCYLYELLTLFSRTIYAITQKKKQNHNLCRVSLAGVGCWTESLTDAWGSFDLMHDMGRTRQPGVGCGWAR
jgi:hypothetical protein